MSQSTPEPILKTESANLLSGILIKASKKAHELPMSARIKQFITEEGLSELSGCSKRDFVRFIVKEAIDNALDVPDTKHITIRIWRETGALYVLISNADVVSEKEYMTEGKINDVLTFDYSPSSKNAKHIISLGSKGNALQTMIGMSYCFWSKDARPEFTTEIVGHNLRFKIKLLPHDDVIDREIKVESIESIGVTSFLFKLDLSEFEAPFDVVWFFSRLHRSVVFDYSCIDEAKLSLNSDSSSFKNPLSVDQGYGQVGTYSLDDFLKLIDREKSVLKLKILLCVNL